MGLIETLRKAEQQGRGAAQRGFDKARDTWEDAERRIRRKMRIFPRKTKPNVVEVQPSEMADDSFPKGAA